MCLFGEVLGEHEGALAMALTTQCRGPQYLHIRAASELALRERLAARGWDGIETLRLTEGQAHDDRG
ncbi:MULTISPECIES: hypothetical protein [unclassified Streptomyces]|uniref:hypothetical protein n=1 Tax=unclassified Streptomyces TaxID=2593676 RepID=UPI0036653D71